MYQSKQFPFWIFTIAVIIALILPTLLQDGMFMDGLLYSCISKNLSEGIGTFWFPHYSKVFHPFFDQQPPLGFAIQAVFFKLFGTSIYVERGYCILTAIITTSLILVLWRMVFKNNTALQRVAWLPVLFWITIPVCFWAYSNGVMENTMSIFDLLAVISIVKFFKTKYFPLIILSGILIFIASLIKGIQGMFPLVIFFAGWIAYRNFSFGKMVIYSLALLFIPVAIYFLILQNELAFESLNTYLHHRVLNSIQNMVTDDGRFYLIGRLGMELIPMIALSIIIILAKGKRKNQEPPVTIFKNHALFFLLIGISGSFPLIVTLEQRGFYLVNSLPYFAIAAACISAPFLSALTEKINIQGAGFKIFRLISIFLLTGALIFSFTKIGKASRDENTIHDVHLIGRVVPRGDLVGAAPELWTQWSMQEYLVRHYYICMDNKITSVNNFTILEVGTIVPDSVHLEKVNIPTIRYHLYKTKR